MRLLARANPRIPIHPLVSLLAFRYNPSKQTVCQTDHYCQRTRDRDGKCLLTGLQSHTWHRLKAAHIFPHVHDVEVSFLNKWFYFAELPICIQWNRRGYPSLITDPAPILALGGPSKIDSIQNVILLRSDLHDAWDNYEFAVNPDVCCS